MSWLLAVQPDPAQAGALREALRPHITEDLVVVGSVDDALAEIERRLPDVILLPTLAPAAVEDYLVSYLSTIPDARHVQILGMPRLERIEQPVQRPRRALFRRLPMFVFPWWRRRHASHGLRAVGTPVCDPGVFTQDVIAYLAGARAIRRESELKKALGGAAERRRELRLAPHEVPWISLVRFGGEEADMINLSAGGMLLRTPNRPEHRLFQRTDPNVRERRRLTVHLESYREVHAMGRVIRCIPMHAADRTEYEVAFAFDEAVGLHLPAGGAIVTAEQAAADRAEDAAKGSISTQVQPALAF